MSSLSAAAEAVKIEDDDSQQLDQQLANLSASIANYNRCQEAGLAIIDGYEKVLKTMRIKYQQAQSKCDVARGDRDNVRRQLDAVNEQIVHLKATVEAEQCKNSQLSQEKSDLFESIRVLIDKQKHYDTACADRDSARRQLEASSERIVQLEATIKDDQVRHSQLVYDKAELLELNRVLVDRQKQNDVELQCLRRRISFAQNALGSAPSAGGDEVGTCERKRSALNDDDEPIGYGRTRAAFAGGDNVNANILPPSVFPTASTSNVFSCAPITNGVSFGPPTKSSRVECILTRGQSTNETQLSDKAERKCKCVNCSADVSYHTNLAFDALDGGANDYGYLFRQVENVEVSSVRIQRESFTTKNINCKGCGGMLGWRYVSILGEMQSTYYFHLVPNQHY